MKKLLLTAFTVAIAASTQAQITLDNFDMASPGDTIFQIADQAPLVSIAPGNAGANQDYDLRDLNVAPAETLLFKAASASPYAASFPNATMTLSYADYDVFFNNSTSSLTIEGQAGSFGGYSGVVLKNNPVEVKLQFPMTYNTSFSNTSRFKYSRDTNFTYTYQGFPINIDSIRINETKTKTVIADGWGELKTPIDSFNVLRIHETGTIYDTVYVHAVQFNTWIPAYNDTTHIDHFAFWAKAMDFPIVEMDYENGAVSNVTWMKTKPNVSSIIENKSTLTSLFPNPASDALTIQWNNDKLKTVKIYNSIGALVIAESGNSLLTRIDLANIPAGVYVVVVEQDGLNASFNKVVVK
jgi:hypothetical protein